MITVKSINKVKPSTSNKPQTINNIPPTMYILEPKRCVSCQFLELFNVHGKRIPTVRLGLTTGKMAPKIIKIIPVTIFINNILIPEVSIPKAVVRTKKLTRIETTGMIPKIA